MGADEPRHTCRQWRGAGVSGVWKVPGIEQQRPSPAMEGYPESTEPGSAGLRPAQQTHVPQLSLTATQAPASLAPSSPRLHRLKTKPLNPFSELPHLGGLESPAGSQGCCEGILCQHSLKLFPGYRHHTACAADPQAPAPLKGDGASAGAGAEPLLLGGHGTGQHLMVHLGEQSQHLPWLLEQDPAARGCSGWGIGDRPSTGTFNDATHPMESLHPCERGSGKLAAVTPADLHCPLSCSPTFSPSLSQLLSHQPSSSQSSSRSLEAKCKETALQLRPRPLVYVPRQRPPKHGAGASPRAASQGQGRDAVTAGSQQQRGQGRWKRGRSPPLIAVSGCLLGRCRTVWQSPFTRLRVPIGVASGTQSVVNSGQRGVTGATWGWRGVRRSRQTAGSSLPFLRSEPAQGTHTQ